LVLGQLKVDAKTNEITAIPQLIDLLLNSGCIVTIDAMGCQKAIAAKVIEKDADDVFGLKANQNDALDAVKFYFDTTTPAQDSAHQTTNGGHGRIEVRNYRVASPYLYLSSPSGQAAKKIHHRSLFPKRAQGS
jgi:predicted transposase YbfD/YdcC